MVFYILVAPDGKPQGVWEITDRKAIRRDVVSSLDGPGHSEVEPGEDIWNLLRMRCTAWFDAEGHCHLQPITLAPGQYYRRMARPSVLALQDSLGWCPDTRNEKNRIAVARGQLLALTRQLGLICQTVHPAHDTLSTYGHEIRNLLILASTEVEAHWRGVLEVNGVGKPCYKTSDYVKLCAAMKLDEYGIAFPHFPWLQPMTPFAGWLASEPTKSLAWYSAYNAVKHDRENKFPQATLAHAFSTVATCFVMILAQYGRPSRSLGNVWEGIPFLSPASTPTWSIKDAYIRPFGDYELSAVPFPF
jgi:hypothetical protein